MKKIPDNFVKKLKKLDNYFILKEEDEYFIIGTEITIKEHVEVHTTFSTYAIDKDKALWVFFVLRLYDKQFDDWEKINEFKERGIPILNLQLYLTSSKSDKLEIMLNEFVIKKFKNH